MNKLTVGGHFAKKPETFRTANQKDGISFDLPAKIYDYSVKKEQVVWVKCSLYGDRAAKIGPKLLEAKGCTVTGELTATLRDSEDGLKQYVNLSLLIDDVSFDIIEENHLVVAGSLGRDAVIRASGEDGKVASTALAFRSGYGQHEKTSWISFSLFGKRAEANVEHLKKGTRIGASGEVAVRSYTDGKGKECRELVLHNVAKLNYQQRPDKQPSSGDPHPANYELPEEDHCPF